MTDSDSLKNDLIGLYRNALKESLMYIKEYFQSIDDEENKERYVPKHYGYPLMDEFVSGNPRFTTNKASQKISYRELLTKNSNHKSLTSWVLFFDFFLSNDHLKQFYSVAEYINEDYKVEGFESFWTENRVYERLLDFVERYIYWNDENLDYDDEKFDFRFHIWFNSFESEKLPIQIFIPILLVDFDLSEIELDEGIWIKKMSNTLQLSRNDEISLTDSSKSLVAGCAKFALVIEGWTVANKDQDSRRKALFEISSYSPVLKLVDRFFSIFRMVTGINTGYSQLVAKSDFWEDMTTADLDQVVTVSTKSYPDYFDNFGWLNSPSTVSVKDVESIVKYFRVSKDSHHNRVHLALSRLNRAFLRNKEEDTILDITIAFESLITHDSPSEITYRLSTRVSTLCKLHPFEDRTAFEVFQLCKKIYSYRSAVVHGDERKMAKTRMLKGESKPDIPIISTSLSLLRHVISILLECPEFNQPINIDKCRLEDSSNE